MKILEKIDYIIEATKPSFIQYFFNKNNYKKLQKEFYGNYEEIAMELGNDIIDDDRYYTDEDRESEEIDPVEAYENYSHSMGYQAEYDAAELLVKNNKSKYNYQHGDESESKNSMIEDLIEYMGYSTQFGNKKKKRKEEYWKMAEQK